MQDPESQPKAPSPFKNETTKVHKGTIAPKDHVFVVTTYKSIGKEGVRIYWCRRTVPNTVTEENKQLLFLIMKKQIEETYLTKGKK